MINTWLLLKLSESWQVMVTERSQPIRAFLVKPGLVGKIKVPSYPEYVLELRLVEQ